MRAIRSPETAAQDEASERVGKMGEHDAHNLASSGDVVVIEGGGRGAHLPNA